MTYRRVRLAQIGRGKVTDFAVQELRRYLRQMDAHLVVDVLIEDAYESTRQGVLWVGEGLSDVNALLPATAPDPAMDDAILIDVKQGSGILTGTNERSVLLAVYRFLKELGCAFVRPGADGERIPQKEIDSPTVYVREAASYRHRGVCIEGADSYDNIRDMIDFLPKVGLNEYFVQFLVPGTFFERWYFHVSNPYLEKEGLERHDVEAMTVSLEEEIARRGIAYHKTGHGWTCEPFGIDGTSWDKDRTYEVPPETQPYLAELNGERQLYENVPLNTNLCYSNPAVRDAITSAITQYCQRNPQVTYLHFWLADGTNNHCECEACRKKRPADWYVQMLNELDEKMTAAGVSTKVVFLIYVDLLWEPQQEQIKHPDRFVLMFAPITRAYGKCYGDFLHFDGELPAYERNHLTMPRSLDQNLAHLRRWQAGFSGDSFDYDYHLMWPHIADPGYEKCAQNLFQDMKDLHAIGLNGMMSCQVQRCSFPTGLPLVMMANALWNEKSEYESQAKAYYQAAYGSDGEAVHAYLQAISELFHLYDGPAFSGESVTGPLCEDYVALQEKIAAFQPVIERNLQKGGACRKEWEILQFHSAYVSLMAEAVKEMEMGEIEQAKAHAAQLFDLVNQNELALQAVLDVYNMQNVFRSKLKM